MNGNTPRTRASNAVVSVVDFYSSELAASEADSAKKDKVIAQLVDQLKAQEASMSQAASVVAAARKFVEARRLASVPSAAEDVRTEAERCAVGLYDAVDALDARRSP